MSEKIVVIGSNSFSGSHFVKHCLQEGLHVLGMSRSEEPIIPFLPYRWKEQAPAGFSFEQLDLNRDTDKIIAAIRKYEPGYVVNFAAQGMVAESWLHPEHWYQTNVMGNVKLHDQLRHCTFLKKYVHISTPEVYGTCEGNVLETAPFNPSTPYAASRAACELHLNTFFKNYHFPVVFTRAANVYGPGQQLYRIIPRTVLSILLGKKIPLHGGGHSVRAFIHIDDVAAGTLSVARKGTPGEGYHLSTARFVSIRELVTMICDRMKVPFEKVVDIVDERPGKDAAYLLDSTKSSREFNWHPKIALEEGIDQVIAWAREYLPTLQDQPLEYLHKE
jgi:dTDP-glucose 4,6-dehydratase